MYACSKHTICRESMGRIEGLRRVDRGREVGGNRIKVNLVQIGAFDSRSCTQAQVAIHSGPRHHSLGVGKAAEQQTANMPADLNGYWKMISNDNFEEYLKALGEYVAGHSGGQAW